MIIAGCTITPKIVRPAAPSIDGGVSNSGILSVQTNGTFVVTELFSERYAELIKLYGDKLLPPMSKPRWITPTPTNTFIITADGMNAYGQLIYFYRQHQKM